MLIDFPDFHGLLVPPPAPPRDPAHLLRQPAGLGVAPLAGADASRSARGGSSRSFPFETEIYRRLGADAVWAGHPLVEDVRGRARASPRRCPRRRGGGSSSCPAAAPRRGRAALADADRGRGAAGAPARPRGRRGPRAERPGLAELLPGAAERGIVDLRRPAPDPRVRGPRVRRLGHGDARGRALRHADGRRLPDLGVQPRDRARPRAPAVDVARQHRGRRGGRPRAPPGSTHRRERSSGRPSSARIARSALAAHEAALARVARELGTARSERSRRGARPLRHRAGPGRRRVSRGRSGVVSPSPLGAAAPLLPALRGPRGARARGHGARVRRDGVAALSPQEGDRRGARRRGVRGALVRRLGVRLRPRWRPLLAGSRAGTRPFATRRSPPASARAAPFRSCSWPRSWSRTSSRTSRSSR